MKIKLPVKYFGLTLLILLMFPVTFAQEKSQIAFKISEPDLIPEGIAYDKRKITFYIGGTYLRKIVSIDEKGAVKNFTGEAQDGLRGVLGMRVDEKRRVLWAISSDAGLVMQPKSKTRWRNTEALKFLTRKESRLVLSHN